jgi:hypothetical protein
MNLPDYRQFFEKATGGCHDPLDYQIRLAEDPECKSRLINIPAGCGETASVDIWRDHLSRTMTPAA